MTVPTSFEGGNVPDPVLLNLGYLNVKWYGVLFVIGLVAVWLLMRLSAKLRGDVAVSDIDSVMLWISIGAIFGGHIGDLVLYRISEYINHPTQTFFFTDGGMSFHGGLIGVCIAICFYAYSNGLDVLRLGDLAAGAAPIGLFFGRIGNLFNQELFGIDTDQPWGIVFSYAGGSPRHPTQIYEAVLEGAALLVILYPQLFRRSQISKPGMIFAEFLILYSIIRIGIEPLRADAQWIDFQVTRLTLGQLYCIPMLIFGSTIVWTVKGSSAGRSNANGN
jgi:phosphatidylglycerol---prolipoprotein diacylglyceryl transferase